MAKERFAISASSLGNYFGVGFISPMEQLEIDLGEREPEFTESQKARMNLGISLEDGMINYFEQMFNTKIFNRNTEVLNGFDGKLRFKIDGECLLYGEPTIVENKISKLDFTEEMGYILQVNAYMESKGYKQAILCGLSAGDPLYKILHYDKEIVEDIREVVDCVFDILNGLADKEDYPWHIVEKYSPKEEPLETIDSLENDDIDYVDELYDIKNKKAELEKREKELRAYLETQYYNKIYNGDRYSFSVKSSSRSGGYDINLLAIEHPEINIEAYKKPDTTFKTIRFTKAKSGK